MAMLDKKVAQERLDAFYAKLEAGGKSWDQFLKERDADEDERFAKTAEAAKKILTTKAKT